MKVLKYKKLKNNRYKVSLDDMELTLYEDVILKYGLLIKKEIDPKDLDLIQKDNTYYEVYYIALNSINARFKSVFDTKEYLRDKGYPYEMIDPVIEKLLQQGYLNDTSFIKSFINNKMVTTNYGPRRIVKDLMEHRVDANIVSDEIEVFDAELQYEKAEKLANRFYKSNHTRGGSVLRQKITNDLIQYGFDSDIVQKVLMEFDFSNDSDLAKKEYDKLYRKLSRKYEGKELEMKIKEKMYQKGLKYEE
ncbi:MAG: RecX family transcriptional regulator [Bacilli bacterium]|nr:RecX family transcriptional regulator [Bacilli bacterium]